jgi:hypothetical protein
VSDEANPADMAKAKRRSAKINWSVNVLIG